MRFELSYNFDIVDGKPVPELYQDIEAQALVADQLGFDAIYLAEHHFEIYGRMPAPLLFLARLGALTTRLLNIHRLASENLQFAGFVRDNWVGVSVAGLLARPSIPPVVIECVTTRQIAPTLEAVQSAIDAVEAQVSAPQPDPAERQAAAATEFQALDAEIREAQAMMLRGIKATAPALALMQQRLTPEQFDALLREEGVDHTLADVLIGCAAEPPESLDELPESFIALFLPWALSKYTMPVPPMT